MEADEHGGKKQGPAGPQDRGCPGSTMNWLCTPVCITSPALASISPPTYLVGAEKSSLLAIKL